MPTTRYTQQMCNTTDVSSAHGHTPFSSADGGERLLSPFSILVAFNTDRPSTVFGMTTYCALLPSVDARLARSALPP